ncbi:BRCA1-associated protein isoform X1 [Selaginella moellendorffii]|uniref:BRCA1-associated protein isoform X1 n=1 Tax=Selaginella moellendorffii TaxID=88036 RepID=UPI000D1C2EB3|nr:BRCA1-associated protein isoform X1 [Selaginella moellendorffii]|eukprot:XP_024543147.1 BRCA1-associated protein isoform X1 [Selaginella moellendorffii]
MFSVKVHEIGDHSVPSELPDWIETLRFSSGNPRVETTRGEMHLFRNTAAQPGAIGALPSGRNEQLCILAVPSLMTGADLCQFTGSFFQSIKEMRIVSRNETSKDRYSVVMKFEDQISADEFFRHFNGRPFSSLQEQICHVLFVADVEYTSAGGDASSAPSGLTELPSCAVCLERLDQHVSGILTTVCNHSFHTSCISKWTDSTCPVCRYCQEKYENSTCSVCSTADNLWICVICGFVGCGRYEEGHAINHWRETQHCYSLELETQRVWDYVGDNYVHRLIQSKTDGKLVELNAPCQDANASCECSGGMDFAEAISRSKIDAAKYDYEHLLSVQMESQRQHHELLMAQALEERAKSFKDREKEIERGVSLKLQTMQDTIRKAEEEKAFLEQMNECLRKNQEEWRTKYRQLEENQALLIKERDNKIQDLEEQVRDFMVFIEAQRTISKHSEMQQGNVLVGDSSSEKRKVARNRRKR